MERPFHPDEVRILKRGVPPLLEKAGSGDTFNFSLLFLLAPFYGLTGYFLNLFMPLYQAILLPLIVLILLFFVWHFFKQILMNYRFGHAIVETVASENIRIDCNENTYTVMVYYGNDGTISWTGSIAVMLQNVPGKTFKDSLAPYADLKGGETKYAEVPLSSVFWEKPPARRWIQFSVNKATSRFWLEDRSLGDYLRTEYDLVRSSKTGELLFVRLNGGSTITGINVSFSDADIRHIMPGEG